MLLLLSLAQERRLFQFQKGRGFMKMNLGISIEKVASLLKAGHLCAADIQCLDKQTKQELWQLCLWCCDKRAVCHQAACKMPTPTNKLVPKAVHAVNETDIKQLEGELIFTRKG
ncbi:hypothetical protein Sden_1854 [Shewanella denitrificans OS217]|jgi:hypothetical protein|uniref:Uncharacterized protein n=2 Tax=Shewanella TaxID=22 RepID=Q12N38_SHEDO|nr:hypothetical protein Sden_1854 [Shewanella denitrificans OS217]